MIACSLSHTWIGSSDKNCHCYFDEIIDLLSNYSDITLTDYNGMTALHHACFSGKYYSTKLFLSLLINRQQIFCLKIKDKKYSQIAQDMAYSRGHVEICKLFANVDDNINDNNSVVNTHTKIKSKNDLNGALTRILSSSCKYDEETNNVCTHNNVHNKHEKHSKSKDNISNTCHEHESEFQCWNDNNNNNNCQTSTLVLDSQENELDWNDYDNDNAEKCNILTEMLDANAVLIEGLQTKVETLTKENSQLNQLVQQQNDLIFSLRSQINKFLQSELESNKTKKAFV